jgi:hypothetical protein
VAGGLSVACCSSPFSLWAEFGAMSDMCSSSTDMDHLFAADRAPDGMKSEIWQSLLLLSSAGPACFPCWRTRPGMKTLTVVPTQIFVFFRNGFLIYIFTIRMVELDAIWNVSHLRILSLTLSATTSCYELFLKRSWSTLISFTRIVTGTSSFLSRMAIYSFNVITSSRCMLVFPSLPRKSHESWLEVCNLLLCRIESLAPPVRKTNAQCDCCRK